MCKVYFAFQFLFNLVSVSITSLHITTSGSGNKVSVVSGEFREITCTTDTIRPTSWIHWYIGGRNVTIDAVQQPPQQVGTMFISSSILNYTGNKAEHNKSVYCEAGNINGRLSKSSEAIGICILGEIIV